ncbi:MAG TPA: DUF4349 domain-containing protein [Ktedonobacteraceae bacterium]|nr:DUF4349 domain-containing protein [Ktedonobacteraceae bacterium]
MQYIHIHKKWRIFCLVGIVVLAVFLAGCGGAAPTASPSMAVPNSGVSNANSGATSNPAKAPGGGGQTTGSTSFGPQYVIKTLNVGMAVKDTRKTADEIQAWITTADPQATSTGINYTPISDNFYNISMSFSVQATLYPQVANYLKDYPSKQQGRLTGYNESVQDATNDYIDTQSRLKNLHAEQDRLLDLMSHAQALGDVMTINQSLTDVEGQIESTEAHLKALNGQVAFYNVSISLQPIDVAPPPPSSGWSVTQIFHDAFAASLAFGQALLAFLIWLLAFSIYIIPATLILWLVFRWKNNPYRAASLPKPNPVSSAYTPTPPDVHA